MSRATFEAPITSPVGVSNGRDGDGQIDEPSASCLANGLEVLDPLAPPEAFHDRVFFVVRGRAG